MRRITDIYSQTPELLGNDARLSASEKIASTDDGIDATAATLERSGSDLGQLVAATSLPVPEDRVHGGRRRFLALLGTGLLGTASNSVLARVLVSSSPPMDQAAVTEPAPLVRPPVTEHDFIPKRFDQSYVDDVMLTPADLELAYSLSQKLNAVRDTIGFGHFNTMSLDQTLACSRQYSAIGDISPREIALLEEIFYRDAADFGFKGLRVIAQLDHAVAISKIVKVGNHGNFLYHGSALKMYRKMQRDIGADLTLTSGIRGVVKQASIFLERAVAVGGNLSLTSRSIAPPGYSYHSIGDFDVGQVSLGVENFTIKFLQSDVYQRINELDYVQNRYQPDNALGVRFEPWHVKVV